MWRIRIRQSLYLMTVMLGVLIFDVYGFGREVESSINDCVRMYMGSILCLLTYGVKE